MPNNPPPQEPNQEPNPVQVDRVTIKPPPFWKTDPKLWFIQLEAQFQLAKVTADETKYHYVVSAIDTEVLTQVSDFILNPPPQNKYQQLKDKLINLFSDSREKKLRKLLSDIELGDRKPSQLLAEMSRLGGTAVPKDLLKTLWMQHLPTHIQAILTTSTDSLENLVTMADKIAEIEQPSVHAVSSTQSSPFSELEKSMKQLLQEVAEIKKKQHEGRSRSRSKSFSNQNKHHATSSTSGQPNNWTTDECWYHSKFGDRARKCTTPCKHFKQTTENK